MTPSFYQNPTIEQVNNALAAIALAVTVLAAFLALVFVIIALAKLARLAWLLLGGGWPR